MTIYTVIEPLWNQVFMYQNKSRKRILTAFRELLLHHDYCDITVLNIINQADVSKSTFYRHYTRKLDIFIDMHNGIFQTILQDFNTPEDWLHHKPHSAFIKMATIAVNKNGAGRSMIYMMGNDWGHASRLIRQNLADEIQLKLEAVFSEHTLLVPVADVSGAIAALHIDYITQLNQNSAAHSIEQQTQSLKNFTRAIINSSLKN
tara:strand:+ start:991 stop:1602 length:612 start_codon:yes stop_codon:yes gene_type:complete